MPGAGASGGDISGKMKALENEIRACRLCAGRFAGTVTGHDPHPVAWFRHPARILIAGQAPGMRVHLSGRPFDDPSGCRLRDWLGMTEADFYDRERVAIVPMAFCFPGYDATGADLPPPAICARTWHGRVLAALENVRLTVLVGGYAQAHHLGGRMSVTERVRSWRDHAPEHFVVPHPSWRNAGWLKRNAWFEAEVLPALRAQVAEVLHG